MAVYNAEEAGVFPLIRALGLVERETIEIILPEVGFMRCRRCGFFSECCDCGLPEVSGEEEDNE